MNNPPDRSHPNNHVSWPLYGDELVVAVDSNRPALRQVTCYRLGAGVRMEFGNEHHRAKIVMNLESDAARELAKALVAAADNLDETLSLWRTDIKLDSKT